MAKNKKQFIKIGRYNIRWLGDSFEKHFGNIKVAPKKVKLVSKILEKPMIDKEILSKFQPTEITLDELVWALKNKKGLLENGYANIFYIRDAENTLWTVNAHWDSVHREWHVYAGSVENPDEWGAGRQVLSRKFGTGNLDSWNLDGEILEIKGIKYKLSKYKLSK